jgi:hypothetical protein
MEEEITRAAAGKTSSSSGKTSSSGRKTSSTAKKKPASSTAKKKPASTAAKKKTSSSTALKLTAAEKKLITNYRKCGSLQKQIIALIVEKVAGGLTKIDGIERMINDQGDLL